MDSKERVALFKGKTTDIEKLEQSNVIRIFISSTFSDMAVERNLLLEKAYPSLRKFCQQIGLELQVMDMRWGIQDAANVDHSTCELCLREIKTCRRLSMGPYFVAFVGNRYGHRPIPSSLSLECYNGFCRVINDWRFTNSELVSEWYKRDDNAKPPCYILQPITAKYPWFDDTDPSNDDKRKADRKSWAHVSNCLSEVLRQCAKKAIEEEIFKEDEAMLFFTSVTEMEIKEGLTSQSSEKPIFMYRREITNIADHVGDAAAQRYVDLKEKGTVDNEAQTLLEKLKNEMDQLIGSSENMKTYQIKWLSDQGINPNSKVHMNYLEKFCNDFVTDMKTTINLSIESSNQSNVADNDQTLNSDWMFEEVAHHAAFAKIKCAMFCGRTLLIESIYTRLFDKDLRCPVTVFGESGKGKTALMGMLVQRCRERSENDVIVYRFLGTSPNSSHVHNVLQTLILQITEAFQLPIPAFHLLQNFNSVVQRFSKCLNDVSQLLESDGGQKANLIIILDSLDQISPLDGAHRLNWLPKKIPRNIKILLSTLPDPKLEILKNLRYFFPGKAFIEVPDLDEETGKEILNSWLAKEKRGLTEEQHKLVMNAFLSCSTPLFLKLAFDEAKNWYSYTDVATLKMADSARGAISLFFDRLELIHGRTFVSKAIGYLVATKSGISEGELEDLLSLDNDVLDSSYTYWSPPSKNIVRIPSLLWTRLRFDLGGDIVERQTVGHTVLALYHRQFVEVARERYLGENVRSSIHEAIAHYFLGTWSDGKKKPLKLKVWKNKTVYSDRQASSQPFKFSDRVFNFRKLDELPFQLLKAGMWETLCDVVLCSATWLKYKIKAFAIKDVLDDYNAVLEEKSDPGITLIRDAIKLAKPTLEFPGGIKNHLCSELYGRLAYFKNDFPATVGRLVSESSTILHEASEPNLIPLSGCFQPPGGPLRTTLIGFSEPITSMKVTPNKSILVAGSLEGLIIAWQAGSDEVMYTVKAHTAEVKCLAISGTRLVSGSPDNTLYIMNVDSGSKVAIIEEDHSGYEEHGSVELSQDSNTLLSACGSKVNVWDVSGLQCMHSFDHSHPLSCPVLFVADLYVMAGYKNGAAICWLASEGKKVYEISSERNNTETSDSSQDRETQNEVTAHCGKANQYFTWWKDGSMAITDLKTGSRISSFQLEVSGLVAFEPQGKIFAVCDKSTVHMWAFSDAHIQHLGRLRYHHGDITTMNFDDFGKTLVVGSADEQISIWSVGSEPFGDDKLPSEVMQGMGATVDHLLLLNRVVASASSKVFYIKLWNVKREKIVEYPPSYFFEDNNNHISPCGHFLAMFDNFTKEVTIQDLHRKDSYKSSLASLSEDKTFSSANLDLENFLFTSIIFPSTSDYLLCSTNIGIVFKIRNPLSGKKALQTTAVDFIDLSSDRADSAVVMSSSPDCQTCLVVTRAQTGSSETLFFINAATMAVMHTAPTKDFNINGEITAVCIGNVECAKSYAFLGTSDCLVHVIALEKQNQGGKVVSYRSHMEATLSDHKSPITALAISPGQDYVFSGSLGKTRRLWHFKDGRWKVHLELFFESLLETGATHATFTKDGKYVISGSRERSLKLWELESGQLVAAQYVYATVIGITATYDNRIFATTKMGYVIANEFYKGKSKEEKRNSAKPPSTSQPSKARKNSSKTARSSSACRIV